MPMLSDVERFAERLARDAANPADVDLLVIRSLEGPPVAKAIEILHRLNPDFPIDLLVRTPEQLR